MLTDYYIEVLQHTVDTDPGYRGLRELLEEEIKKCENRIEDLARKALKVDDHSEMRAESLKLEGTINAYTKVLRMLTSEYVKAKRRKKSEEASND